MIEEESEINVPLTGLEFSARSFSEFRKHCDGVAGSETTGKSLEGFGNQENDENFMTQTLENLDSSNPKFQSDINKGISIPGNRMILK